ncbi:uncharacterized protein LALA0_S03e04324g [Lachancea lanzarotensis]|uniref:LALA0S03e04324g1_1 n=1 Tax=Lachancea lanzarotensis TaxID=1245769 RepID=A0A0C7N0P2_9SACH|nr:uncharacterized protein LALA0_S03e04324g [Lachancea lanzarotensis]CEP61504.1 LALA0S03e04324g1_1 [Lachancea lanzarotensis]
MNQTQLKTSQGKENGSTKALYRLTLSGNDTLEIESQDESQLGSAPKIVHDTTDIPKSEEIPRETQLNLSEDDKPSIVESLEKRAPLGATNTMHVDNDYDNDNGLPDKYSTLRKWIARADVRGGSNSSYSSRINDLANGPLFAVEEEAGFLPHIAKINDILINEGRGYLIPNRNGYCLQEPTIEELWLIDQLMNQFVSFSAYPPEVERPGAKGSGYRAWRQLAGSTSESSQNDLGDDWKALKFDLRTNPFVFARDVEILLERSLETGYMQHPSEAKSFIIKSIRPEVHENTFLDFNSVCIAHSMSLVLDAFRQYGYYGSFNNRATWRTDYDWSQLPGVKPKEPKRDFSTRDTEKDHFGRDKHGSKKNPKRHL